MLALKELVPQRLSLMNNPHDISKAWSNNSTAVEGSREIIIESARIGNSLRVTAVDTKTGTEVTFQAPHYASKLSLQRLAVSKMKYVLKKQGG